MEIIPEGSAARMKKAVKLFVSNYSSSILAGIICLFIVVGILAFPSAQKTSIPERFSEYSSVISICELATLKSFYHNVAMYEKEPDGSEKFVNDVLLWPFGGYSKVGYKQFWLEYSGIVETGIDASQIQIHEPNAQAVVEVFIPDAKVISVYADESTLTEPLSENGWFTTISGKEKAEAFASAQTAMRQEAENDQTLLKRAKENAKILLERYIINIGKELGTTYSVVWIEKPQQQS